MPHRVFRWRRPLDVSPLPPARGQQASQPGPELQGAERPTQVVSAIKETEAVLAGTSTGGPNFEHGLNTPPAFLLYPLRTRISRGWLRFRLRSAGGHVRGNHH